MLRWRLHMTRCGRQPVSRQYSLTSTRAISWVKMSAAVVILLAVSSSGSPVTAFSLACPLAGRLLSCQEPGD